MKRIAFFLSLIVLLIVISYYKMIEDIAIFSPLHISDAKPSHTDNAVYPHKVSPSPSSRPATASESPTGSISQDEFPGVMPSEYRRLKYYYPDNEARYAEYKYLNPDYDYEKVILHVNIGLDLPFYTNINTIEETNRLDILVNKYNKLPDSFVPKLEQLPASLCAPGTGNQYLRKEAKEAFERMHHDAKEQGLNITAYGTYRSIELQHSIWNSKVNSGRTIEDVDRLNSRGGHSEHHTGLAIDVIKNNYYVEDTLEFKWYKDNAHLYGFIIRYPEGKESITGYSYEPWHLRYLGPDLATEVYYSGLTFDEYYAMMIGY